VLSWFALFVLMSALYQLAPPPFNPCSIICQEDGVTTSTPTIVAPTVFLLLRHRPFKHARLNHPSDRLPYDIPFCSPARDHFTSTSAPL
jgi:hypothetical protein